MSDVLSKFLNIWEVEPHFKCPVIGAMLSVEKHRNILKKCGYDVKQMKPYEYHRCIMENLNDENTVSIKVNNFIRNQARKHMLTIAGLSEKEIRTLWKTHLENGNVGPLLYAIISHPDTSVALLSDVSGEVHMQAHANMTGIFTIRRQLQTATETLDRERKKSREKQGEIKELIRIRKSQDQTIARLSADNRKQGLRLKDLEGRQDPTRASQLEARVLELEAVLEKTQNENRNLERQKRGLELDLFDVKSQNDLLQAEFKELVDQLKESPSCLSNSEGDICTHCATCSCKNCTSEECPGPRLCAKRIFMIGGITKMKAHYKDIVEGAGGEFDYHDGYMKNANANLEAKVKRSDVVICPVSCNSHNACIKVKKLCNRYNKELKILNSSSLSALTRAVFDQESSPVN